MVYDEDLANRIRELLADQEGVTEKRMFGGLAFLVHGNMAVAASRKGGVLVRIDPDESDDLVAAPGVERMVMGGREMENWLYVDPG
ncbi:MAG: TfoX/Sxy family protein, partial [Thermoleophilaceae bacterium]|nr:TfoX/Sxy family protein [Thermoleophilaceae bacterium]